MEIAALRWFQQVADGVTVTELAELERRSQSGISRALARLEREVGVPLFRRTGRTLRLTQPGALLKRYVDAMLHVLDDGLAAIEAVAAPDTGRVVLAYQPSLGTWLVPELIAGFHARFPAVEFDLVSVRSEAAGATLAQSTADLEITSLPSTTEDVRWRPLASEELWLAVPPGHPLTGSDEVDLADVATEPFVALRPGFALRTTFDELCAGVGVAPAVAFEVDDLATVGALVSAGLGVAVVPAPRTGRPADLRGEDRDIRPWRNDAVGLLPINAPGARRQIGVAWPRDRRLLPAAANFFDYVVTELPRVVRGRTMGRSTRRRSGE